uniref:Uncharacterized protein n=1 Tax=Arundo donax TaxID=35708 RepID=A0A0A8YHQ8_ARUDO
MSQRLQKISSVNFLKIKTGGSTMFMQKNDDCVLLKVHLWNRLLLT